MVTADVELVGLDPAALLQAAFDLQEQRDAARDQAAQLEAELAELRTLATEVLTPRYCPSAECGLPRCRLARLLERPVTA